MPHISATDTVLALCLSFQIQSASPPPLPSPPARPATPECRQQASPSHRSLSNTVRGYLGTGEIWNGKIQHNGGVSSCGVVFEGPKPSFSVSLLAFLAFRCAEQPPGRKSNHPSNHPSNRKNYQQPTKGP